MITALLWVKISPSGSSISNKNLNYILLINLLIWWAWKNFYLEGEIYARGPAGMVHVKYLIGDGSTIDISQNA